MTNPTPTDNSWDQHLADCHCPAITAIEPQPDPRDEVIARLVDALQKIADGNPTIDSPEADAATSRVIACAALAAAKAVQR